MDKDRQGDWMQCRTGGAFYPLDPRPGDFAISDIAWALSHVCRFGGHVLRYYSVAEHSVLVSMLVPKEDRLAGLLHDASEAYLGDVIRPLKRALPDYREIEEKVERAIAQQFGVPYPWPESVKAADEAMLGAERRDIMPRPPMPWKDGNVPPAPLHVEGWSPMRALRMFLARFGELTGDDAAILFTSNPLHGLQGDIFRITDDDRGWP